VTGQWGGGFQASAKITNGAATPINGWRLTWTFANGQVISQLWSGTVAQSGAQVTVTNVDYNTVIPAGGGTTEVGFIASWNNTTNAKPTGFSVNGAACTAA
jgi:cellulase/cellobiase CelA1